MRWFSKVSVDDARVKDDPLPIVAFGNAKDPYRRFALLAKTYNIGLQQRRNELSVDAGAASQSWVRVRLVHAKLLTEFC